MKVSVVNSAGGSFFWNYANDTYSNYAGANVFFLVKKVTVSVAIIQLEVSGTLMQVKISAAYMSVTNFIEIMQVGVSVAIMQVAFSTVHYAQDYFYCNYAGGCFCYSHVCDSFK